MLAWWPANPFQSPEYNHGATRIAHCSLSEALRLRSNALPLNRLDELLSRPWLGCPTQRTSLDASSIGVRGPLFSTHQCRTAFQQAPSTALASPYRVNR